MPSRRQIVGGREAPAAERQHADPDAQRFGARNMPGLAVLGGDLAVARLDGAHIGVGDAAPRHRVERRAGPDLSSRCDQAAQLILLAGGGARKARGIRFGILQPGAGVVEHDAVGRS